MGLWMLYMFPSIYLLLHCPSLYITLQKVVISPCTSSISDSFSVFVFFSVIILTILKTIGNILQNVFQLKIVWCFLIRPKLRIWRIVHRKHFLLITLLKRSWYQHFIRSGTDPDHVLRIKLPAYASEVIIPPFF